MQYARSPGAGLGTLQLPRDILYFIAEISPFKTRASLVRCNRWFHAACVPLIFRDVHLHTPNQLVKFYENKKTASMLHETRSLSLSECLFYRLPWKHQSLDQSKSSYIISILRATTSLLRLQILQRNSDLNIFSIRGLLERIYSLRSDPSFLPRLEVVAGTRHHSLNFLVHNRPVKCQIEVIDHKMRVELYPGYGEPSSIPPIPYPASSRPTHNISPEEVGMLIRESKKDQLVRYASSSVSIIIRHTRGTEHETCLPVIDNFTTWILGVALAADFAPDRPLGLKFTFEPKPPSMSIQEQLEIVKELHTIVPHLQKITISHPTIRWGGRPASKPFARADDPLSTWPEWAPAPNSWHTDPTVLQWWLDFLQIDSSRPQTYYAASQNARAMRDAIFNDANSGLPDWYREKCPPESLIIAYLRGRK